MKLKTTAVSVLSLIITMLLHSQVNEGFDNTTYPPPGWTVSSSGGTTVWSRLTNNTRNGSAGTANSTNPSAGVSKYLTVALNTSANVLSVSYYIAVSSVTAGTGATLVVQAGSDTNSLTTLRTIDLEDGGIFTAGTYIQFTDNIDGTLASGQTGAADLRSSNPAYIRWSHQKVSGSSASCRLEDVSIPNAVALPVELVSFTAIPNKKGVELQWSTATEINNFGFEVERSAIDNRQLNMTNWTRIGFVDGNGTTNVRHSYTFSDNTRLGGTYLYRLKQIDRDGMFKYSSTIEIVVNQIPQEYVLYQNSPNPFNPATSIRYQLPKSEFVTLKVYNVLGKEVAVLENGIKSAGERIISFDGSLLPSGLYFYTLRSANFTATKKMLLIN